MIYFTSDTHYFHVRALELMPNRKYETLDKMNESLIDNYNRTVRHDDFVIFLGDVVMGKKFNNVPLILPRLNGRLCMIYGNHDLAFEDNRPGKHEAAEKLYLDNGFMKLYRGQVALEQVLIDCNEPIPYDLSYVDLCHFPFHGTADHASDGYEVRYEDLHVEDTGRWLFHGHTHATTPMFRDRMINVGVDAWDMFPVSLDTLVNTVGNYGR